MGSTPSRGAGPGSEAKVASPAPILPSIKRKRNRSGSAANSKQKATREVAAPLPAKGALVCKSKTASKRQLILEEKQLAAERLKGLRALKLNKIKELALSKGLDVGSKDSMINGIMSLDAKRREKVRKHRASVKDVIAKKREEFTTKKNKELQDILQAYALKTSGTKPARVERLLTVWQEQGEIEKVLAGRAFQSRKTELQSMSKDILYDLCRKKGVDALSKDILVERLLVHESVEIWQEVLESRQLK
jgi:hypothetical protein